MVPVHHRCFRVPLPPQELRLLSPMVLPVVLRGLLSAGPQTGWSPMLSKIEAVAAAVADGAAGAVGRP